MLVTPFGSAEPDFSALGKFFSLMISLDERDAARRAPYRSSAICSRSADQQIISRPVSFRTA